MSAAELIASNLARVRDEIAEASSRSGRSDQAVKLVAVTKYVSADVAQLLFEAGCHDLGESRPQQLWDKAQALSAMPIHWHMIGHLQRNKLQRTLPIVSLMHSVDSLRLLRAVQAWGAEHQHGLPILIEVNVSRDADKHGFAPREVEAAIRQTIDVPWIDPQGLMCMASLAGGDETARANFRELRELRDELRKRIPDGPALDELSMGMSRDFAIAIEEGATIVRVGSALFEGIDR